ncbi:MAG: DNA polymerase IV [Eubacterium sp.]|nr:DNA polymerase IV [Eubacterium sp.]
MEREILHVDCNKFYASVECCLHPELKDKPVAVGGSEESRHGIILTKNEIASKYNLVVGEPLWKARQKCPNLIIIPPHFKTYMEFSKRVRNIFEDYTDLIEPFGLDECWLDVTGDYNKTGYEIAQEIRNRVREEIGITVSVGLSFNKIFAKLGSDYKKPDALTVIRKDNFKRLVWGLPCNDMIMIGNATKRKLNFYGIYTIGDLAKADCDMLKKILGKNGLLLRHYARGEDNSPVRHMELSRKIKSVGNSTTTPRDLKNDDDVKVVMTVLCESVARRMRRDAFKGTTISISVRTNELESFTRQCKLPAPTNVSEEFIRNAMELFRANYNWEKPIRSIGVSVTDFCFDESYQFDLTGTVEHREKLERLETAVDSLKDRYGNYCIQRASVLSKNDLSHFNPFEDHTIHPISFL